MQDGRTLKKGTREITPMVSSGKFSSKTQNLNNIDETEYDYYPNFSVRAKYGINDKFDAGINFDQATNIGITTKYQFLGNQTSRYNSSIGVDFGANITSALFDKLFYYYSIPLYFSYNISNYSIFVTPRFINNSEYVFSTKHSTESVGYKYNMSRIVVSYGFLFGKKNKYGIEIGHNSSDIFKPTHLSLGYNIRF
jgi:hypothetical protein